MNANVNRISNAITEMESRVEAVSTDSTKMSNLREAASLQFGEWALMGDKATRAHLAGVVTLDEAMSLHAIHGETLAHYMHQSIAARIVYLKVMSELQTRV